MSHDATTLRVREVISQHFAQQGVGLEELPCETILIRDGHYCGRRFKADGHEAIWFVEENELKFFHPDGSLVEVVDLTTPAMERKVA
jgi:hypothetical protein